MPATDREFLQSLFGGDGGEMKKEAQAVSSSEVDSGEQALLYNKAYDLIVKTAAAEAAARGVQFDPESLTEKDLNDMLPDAIAAVLEKNAGEDVGMDKIAEASDAFQMAIEFGEFMGTKMIKAAAGILNAAGEAVESTVKPAVDKVVRTTKAKIKPTMVNNDLLYGKVKLDPRNAAHRTKAEGGGYIANPTGRGWVSKNAPAASQFAEDAKHIMSTPGGKALTYGVGVGVPAAIVAGSAMRRN